MTYTAKHPAAFINALSEGPKRDILEWLQRTWDELQDLRSSAGARVEPGCICATSTRTCPVHVWNERPSVSPSTEQKLAKAGVFKGMGGLRGLLAAQDFWDRQPYSTRLYYGDGGGDYLHRHVLEAAIKLLDSSGEPSAECICPKCGLRHGGVRTPGDF